ncbi:hypothetical protein ALNOE001_06080 [Candidatus Methanobinarius endosymbioticus]|uniref:Uncharacterized protein n=1 Tax=Candidatus Methanobinarius endosymbioticus TaxID=2006182 RepID=A0A366MD11_9EURY|nr:hypothetical protein ALNOE001_06080 [Candidatus Methanobinarius endosymbioticus]
MPLNLENCNFTRNRADALGNLGGGIIHVYTANYFRVTGSNFVNNTLVF